MRALKKFNEFLVKMGSWGTIFFMAVMAVVIPYEVIGRYVFQRMTVWSGEVSTYSLAWASMLGAAVGLQKGYQVSMTSVVECGPSCRCQGSETGKLPVHAVLLRCHVLVRSLPDDL